MPYKVTTLFNAVTIDKNNQASRQGGWSESWYTNLAIDSPALNAAWDALCTTRAALLANNTKIIGQRIQQVDPVGPVRTFENTYPGSAGSANDLPQMALEWQMRSQGGFNRRAVVLRGVPDARVVTGEYSPSAAYNAALAAYFEQLRQNWLMRALDRTQPTKRVVIFLADSAFACVTAGPHGLVVGDFINLMSAKTSQGKKVSAVFQVSAISPDNPNAFSVFPNPSANFSQVTGGRIRKRVIQYIGVTLNGQEILDPLAVSRKVGRPFHQFRGRRTAKK